MAAPLARCGCRRLQMKLTIPSYFRALYPAFPRSLSHAQPEEESGTKSIILPKKKVRDPTAVLRALGADLSKDYNAPHYMYADDPYLIPNSQSEKRTFSLAKASGKKAAQWVADQLPEHFSLYQSEPAIKSFMPKSPPQCAEDTIEGLMERIVRNEPLVAFNSYQALKQKGADIPVSTLEDLLGLLSFYNSQDTTTDLEEEEKFYRRDIGMEIKRPLKNTWKSQGPAEQVFEELKEKTPKAYLELLRGRAKYLDTDGAMDLFQEMKQNGFTIPEVAYRTVLSISNFMADNSENKWTFIKGILQEMANNDLTPSLVTFNTALDCLSGFSRYGKSSKWASEILREMKACGVEPSPASYAYVIRIVYNNEEVISDVLNQIIDLLQGQELTVREPADYDFFSTAMPKCYNNVKDLELAYKIDDLLNTGNNYLLLGDAFKQGLYYTFFLRTLCMFEQIDKIMESYEQMTPHVYTPTFMAYEDLLRAIELNEGYQHLPQIWSDLVLFDYSQRNDLVAALLQIMGKKKQPDELQKMYMRITGYIKEKFEEEKLNTRRITPFVLNGDMIGNIMLVNLNGGDYNVAWEFFELYQENKMKVEKFPSENSLVALADASIEHKKSDHALKIIQLMVDCAFPKVDIVAAKATKNLSLTEEQKNFIDDLL